MDILEALAWAIVTLSTVGYGDIVLPHTPLGLAYTIVFVVVGLCTLAWAGANAFAFVVEGHLTEAVRIGRMKKEMQHLNGHYVICGLGRVGRELVGEFRFQNLPYIVIDQNQTIIEDYMNENELYLIGNATDDEILTKAQVQKARGLVACMPSDSDNVFTTLTAKGMNPDLFVIARGTDESARKQLLRAGANRVVMPSHIGAKRIAAMIFRPEILEFLDDGMMVGPGDEPFIFECFSIPPHSPLIGQQLKDSLIKTQTEVMIIGVKSANGKLLINLSIDYVFQEGEVLFGLGHQSAFKSLRELIG